MPMRTDYAEPGMPTEADVYSKHRAELNSGKSSGLLGAVPPASAFQHAENTFEVAGILCNRIVDLANRLVGSVPASPTKESDMPGHGILDQLARRSSSVRVDLAEAMDAVSRIERALP